MGKASFSRFSAMQDTVEGDVLIGRAPVNEGDRLDRYMSRNNFFQHNRPTLMDALNDDSPLCNAPQAGVPLKVFILVATWNEVGLLQKSIRSVAAQDIPGFPYKVSLTLLIYEDESEGMLTEREKYLLAGTMDVSFLRAEGCSKCPRLGPAGSKWHLMQRLKQVANPNDFVIILDGGDTFSHEHVIRDLSTLVLPAKPWFVWGKPDGDHSEQCKDLHRRDESFDFLNYRIRDSSFVGCHPIIFQAHLLDVIHRLGGRSIK